MSGNPSVKNDCHCPYYSNYKFTCEVCSQPIITEQFVDSGKTYCRNCYSTLGLCGECSHSATCEFEENTTCVIDKVKVIQLPNGQMAQIKNPERQKLLCSNCPCHLEEFGCMREQSKGCSKFEKVINK